MIAMFFQPTSRHALLALTLLILTLAMACGNASTATGEPAPNAAQSNAPQAVEGSVKPILATTVLRVGSQRVAFLLTSSEALIKVPEATVTSIYLGEGEFSGEQMQATFHLWPYGVRGAYATQLNFDRPGPWRLDIAVAGPEGPARPNLLEIAEQTSIPEIGTIPPLSANKTVHTVNELAELTTDYSPDPGLYQLTIGNRLLQGGRLS